MGMEWRGRWSQEEVSAQAVHPLIYRRPSSVPPLPHKQTVNAAWKTFHLYKENN